jgi:hypothetical protein
MLAHNDHEHLSICPTVATRFVSSVCRQEVTACKLLDSEMPVMGSKLIDIAECKSGSAVECGP